LRTSTPCRSVAARGSGRWHCLRPDTRIFFHNQTTPLMLMLRSLELSSRFIVLALCVLCCTRPPALLCPLYSAGASGWPVGFDGSPEWPRGAAYCAVVIAVLLVHPDSGPLAVTTTTLLFTLLAFLCFWYCCAIFAIPIAVEDSASTWTQPDSSCSCCIRNALCS
jgi:hypothetical protein